MVLHLNDFRTEKAASNARPVGYSEELLNANWTPLIGVLIATSFQAAPLPSPELPEDFSETDINEFLERVYAFASQI